MADEDPHKRPDGLKLIVENLGRWQSEHVGSRSSCGFQGQSVVLAFQGLGSTTRRALSMPTIVVVVAELVVGGVPGEEMLDHDGPRR